MSIEFIGDDPERIFNPAEQEELTRKLLRLNEEINSSEGDVDYDRRFIQKLHLRLFSGIRDHAGRFRNRDYGEEYLIFGPNRSISAIEVSKCLDEYFEMAAKLIGELDNRIKNVQFVEDVIKVAAYLHAELIRIHPFRDGNGRVSRLAINIIFRRYRLPLHTFNFPRQEYFDALNHFYRTKDIDPLCELLIRVYYDQLIL